MGQIPLLCVNENVPTSSRAVPILSSRACGATDRRQRVGYSRSRALAGNLRFASMNRREVRRFLSHLFLIGAAIFPLKADPPMGSRNCRKIEQGPTIESVPNGQQYRAPQIQQLSPSRPQSDLIEPHRAVSKIQPRAHLHLAVARHARHLAEIRAAETRRNPA